MNRDIPRCKTPKTTYTIDYPEIMYYCEQQTDIFWTHGEVDLEKDLHCIKTELIVSENHGVLTTLTIFTTYELIAGNEYWGGRFKEIFPRPEFQTMAAMFSAMELAVHARFYSKIDEMLGLNTDEFYSSFVKDETLSSRMDFIDNCINDKEDLFSVGVFSMVEGAILYSSFAFLKHFQSPAKNKLINLDAGISFSVRDEAKHAEAGAACFRILLREERELGRYLEDSEEWRDLSDRLYKAAETIYEHEARIADMIFEKGKIDGITDKQLKHFVEHRLDLCLQELELKPLYKPKYNPIKDWFYTSITGDAQHDFFAKQGNSYNRDWSENKLAWT